MTPSVTFDEPRLVALVAAADTACLKWVDDAACAGLPSGPDAFFPDDGGRPTADALTLCSSCRVAAECLAAALVHEARCGSRHGWWGGRSPEERDAIARRVGLEPQPAEPDAADPACVARRLRSQNRTVPSIAAELGCTERTVYRYLAKSAA